MTQNQINHRKHYTLHSPRALWQAYAHLRKVRDYVFDVRAEARKARQLDAVQSLTEAHYHLGQAESHLRQMSKHLFLKDLHELEVYK